jgi:hypothetical protein
MKPSSSNRQLLGLVRNTRRAHSLSGTEIGLDASNNNIRLLSERREKKFFLTSPSYRAHWALSRKAWGVMDDWSANRTLLSSDLTPSTSLSSFLVWLLASLKRSNQKVIGVIRQKYP